VVAVPDVREVLADLVHQERRLAGRVYSQVELCGQHLETVLASAAFRNPLLAIHSRQQHVDELSDDLTSAINAMVTDGRVGLQAFHEQVARIEPQRLLRQMTEVLSELTSRGRAAITATMNGKRMALTAQENHLAGLNPKSVLQRGYSITLNRKTGRVVKGMDDVQVGDGMATELAGGVVIDSTVTGKKRTN
jgi:exodeoxyribonuclease VII large subunit